jgi:parallel beta-helix repeat protein
MTCKSIPLLLQTESVRESFKKGRVMKKILLSISVLCILTLAACGSDSDSGSSDSSSGGDGTSSGGGASSITSQTTLPAGDPQCANGGVKLDYGIDENKNSVLDAGEVDGSEYICNGPTGLSALINTTAADIVNCPYGGIKIESGLDEDEDSVLDADETDPSLTTYVCNPGVIAYTIGGTVSGLEGTGLVLRNNGGDDLSVSANGDFTFPLGVPDTGGYNVTIKTKPAGQTCTVTGGSGTVSGANVTDIAVNCINFGPRHSAAQEWNGYVRASDPSQACDGTETGGYSACIHGGEMMALEVEGRSSCDNLTATDALGAFDWSCDVSTNPVRMVSTGLKANKNLSDLIDFDAVAWKQNSVTVLEGIDTLLTTPSIVWWTTPVVLNNDGGYLNSEGTVYIVNAPTYETTYTMGRSNIGLVIKPGVTLQGSSLINENIIYAADKDFLWLEGAIDASGDKMGVYLSNTRFSVLRNIQADNGTNGVYVSGSSNLLENITASWNGGYGIALSSSSSNNTLENITTSWNNIGINLSGYSTNNNLTNITASNNGYSGVYLQNVSNNTLTDVNVSYNVYYGIYISSASYNTLRDVTASYSRIDTNKTTTGYGSGVFLQSSSNNVLTDVTVSNNKSFGVYLYTASNNNTLANVTVSNNSFSGIELYSSSSNNILSDVTVTNNVDGIFIWGPGNNTLLNIAASNNSNVGVALYSSSNNNTLENVAATYNNKGVSVTSNSSNNKFSGLLKTGYNSTECNVSGGSNPGLVHTTCSLSGIYNSGGADGYGIANSSDATYYSGIATASSFSGKVTTDDGLNYSDTDGGATTYPSTPSTFDWSSFDNHYRGWGPEGSVFPSADNWYQWASGAGRIWDWSLSAGDLGDPGLNGTPGDSDDKAAILRVLSLPAGDDTLAHKWYKSGPAPADQGSCDALMPDSVFVAGTPNYCETTFLRNAVELQGDGTGNDNNLCESNEACLFTPNIGSYQGHGDLTDATEGAGFTDGTITGVTLMKYQTNGY